MNKELDELVELMDVHAHPEMGMDVVIVVTSSAEMSEYWQHRLVQTAGWVVKPTAIVVAVEENWPGGAGNGLGTLFAFLKARQKLLEQHKIDLVKCLEEGFSMGMYHTAGKGTRLAPLVFSEKNNKSAVLLPGILPLPTGPEPLTILEAVIKQTSIYAAGRAGRLSVFWGDQIFIPSSTPPRSSTSHADILIRQFVAPPGMFDWEEQQLHCYGLITMDATGNAQQVEKQDFPSFMALCELGKLRSQGGIGLSLGSFSLSSALLMALIEEFEPELKHRYGRMDSDPHFWMAFTLDRVTYVMLMEIKGVNTAEAEAHWIRMNRFRTQFVANHPGLFFTAIDTGAKGYWWDFGSLKPYLEHCLLLTRNTVESRVMRRFFNMPSARSDAGKHLHVSRSVLIDCRFKRGKILNSILIGVEAEEIEAENSLVIGCKCGRLQLQFSIAYQVLDANTIALDRVVRADCTLPDGTHQRVYVGLDTEIKNVWNQKLEGNDHSFEELYQLLEEFRAGNGALGTAATAGT